MKSRTQMILTMAAVLTVAGAAQAQLSSDFDSGFGQPSQIQENGTTNGAGGTSVQRATQIVHKVGMSADDDPMDVFNTDQVRDLVVAVRNGGLSDAELEVFEDGEPRSTLRRIGAGSGMTFELARVVDLKLHCLPDATGGGNCTVDLDILAVPADAGGVFDPGLWIASPCFGGNVSVEPDSWADCLWNQDLLWNSAVGRDVSLQVDITGNQDLEIEFEYSNNTFWSYDLSAPPALPQFQHFQGFEQDVIAIRIHCSKSPVNACSNCEYSYKLTVE